MLKTFVPFLEHLAASELVQAIMTSGAWSFSPHAFCRVGLKNSKSHLID
jgi:hypothetical protein